jgi:hypothetical protein
MGITTGNWIVISFFIKETFEVSCFKQNILKKINYTNNKIHFIFSS